MKHRTNLASIKYTSIKPLDNRVGWGRLYLVVVHACRPNPFRAFLAALLALPEAPLVPLSAISRRTPSAPASSQRALLSGSPLAVNSMAKDPYQATLSSALSVVLCWAHFSKTPTTTAHRQTSERIRGEGLNNDGWCDSGSQGSGWGTFIYVEYGVKVVFARWLSVSRMLGKLNNNAAVLLR